MSDLPLHATAAPSNRAVPAVLSDAATMTWRALRLSLRNPESLITALVLPVLLMLMFVYLFGGAIHTGGRYVDYVVPGVVLICASFGAGTTAVGVAQDLSGGIIDRFRSMDVRGEALINGQVVASVARNLISTAVVFAVALAIGYRSSASATHWLGAVGVLALFVLALSWVAATIGILAGSAEAATGMSFMISFLAYPSSAFVPIKTMPSWLQGFSRDQPITPVIEAMRGLLNGGPVAANATCAIGWSIGIIAVCLVASGVLFGRRTH